MSKYCNFKLISGISDDRRRNKKNFTMLCNVCGFKDVKRDVEIIKLNFLLIYLENFAETLQTHIGTCCMPLIFNTIKEKEAIVKNQQNKKKISRFAQNIFALCWIKEKNRKIRHKKPYFICRNRNIYFY